jgi:hypothetical protein
MKLRLLALALISTSAFAATETTRLEFDLKAEYYRNHDLVTVNIPKLNKALKAKGLDGLPEKIIIGANPAPYQKLLEKRLEAAKAVLPEDIHSPILAGYYHEYPEICYRGKAREAVKILDAMVGNFFQETQGVLAMRFGKTVKILWKEFSENPEVRQNYIDNGSEDILAAWDNYNTKSDTIVVLSDLGHQGDGTELYFTEIKRCQ